MQWCHEQKTASVGDEVDRKMDHDDYVTLIWQQKRVSAQDSSSARSQHWLILAWSRCRRRLLEGRTVAYISTHVASRIIFCPPSIGHLNSDISIRTHLIPKDPSIPILIHCGYDTHQFGVSALTDQIRRYRVYPTLPPSASVVYRELTENSYEIL